MKHSSAIDFAHSPIFPLLVKMSTPSMAAMLAFAVYNLLDSIWLARLGSSFIAAYTITFPFQMLLVALGIGTGVGAGSYAARMLGAKNLELVRATSGQVIFLSLFMGTIMITAVTLWPEEILSSMGGKGEILSLARGYLSILVWGTPLVFFINTSTNLFRAVGRPAEAMYTILIFSISGVFLDPIFIFGWGPVPKLGIEGAALSAVISQLLASIVATKFFFHQPSPLSPKLKHLIPYGNIVYSIYQTGFPSIILNLVFGLVVTVYNHTLTPYGPYAIGTLSLCFRINGLIMMVLFGIGHGVMPLVGYHLGAGLKERLGRIVRSAIFFSGVVGIVSCITILLLSRPIIASVTGDDIFRSVTEEALKFFAFTLIFAGPTVVWINMFIGLGKGLTAMTLLFIRDALILIPSIYLGEHFLGLTGIWLSQLISTGLGFVMIGFWAHREVSSLIEKA